MDTEYDEFGNPIGGTDSSSGSSSENSSSYESEMEDVQRAEVRDQTDVAAETAIILPEDRKPYQSVSEAFGEGVETIVATGDAKSISEPIVEPLAKPTFKIEEDELPETTYSKEYMWRLSGLPSKVRNVALMGGYHSGKTMLVDMLVQETHRGVHPVKRRHETALRYTDNHRIELDRGISVKATTMTTLQPNLNGNSVVLTVVDAPGHTNFVDEVCCATRLTDGTLLCVDVVEGVTESVKLAVRAVRGMQHQMCLVLTKIDRLILELRYKPLDAYFKILKVIEDVNRLVDVDVDAADGTHFSPVEGNVAFESATFDLCFTLQSFARLYAERAARPVDLDVLVEALWGDVYLVDGRFTAKPENPVSQGGLRTFVKLVLEPIYKIATHSIVLESDELEEFCREKLGLRMRKAVFKEDPQILLKKIVREYFGNPAQPLVGMIEEQLPAPSDASATESVLAIYTGSNDAVVEAIKKCNPSGPLVAYIPRLVSTTDGDHFYAEVRVLSGTLKAGSKVQLLGEDYSEEFKDDMKLQDIKRTFLEGARYRVSVDVIAAGSVGLIAGHGIDTFITKTASVFDTSFSEENLHIFKPEQRLIQPVFKLAVQPYVPTETSKFIDGLKSLNKSYIGFEVKVEEGGEHAVIGYGELYMDCLLHDLRKLYAKIDIKVSDPMTRFAETCVEMSAVKLSCESNNGKNRITIIAEPLDPQISLDLEEGKVPTSPRAMRKFFKEKHGWDALSARSIWSIGSTENHSSAILCDDTLPDEVDKEALESVKDAIVQGFKWGSREGPLCGEPIRDVRFRIIEADISSNYAECNNAQIIQMTRRACHCGMMTATPKLLEPIYGVEIETYSNISSSMVRFVDRRRGEITNKRPIEGTPLCLVHGVVPVIESAGLETDIRLLTQGKAMCQQIFNRWEITPGDPLDSSCYVPVLKPAPKESLARDFTMKTRKRKGIEGEPSLQHYVSPDVWEKLKGAGLFA